MSRELVKEKRGWNVTYLVPSCKLTPVHASKSSFPELVVVVEVVGGSVQLSQREYPPCPCFLAAKCWPAKGQINKPRSTKWQLLLTPCLPTLWSHNNASYTEPPQHSVEMKTMKCLLNWGVGVASFATFWFTRNTLSFWKVQRGLGMAKWRKRTMLRLFNTFQTPTQHLTKESRYAKLKENLKCTHQEPLWVINRNYCSDSRQDSVSVKAAHFPLALTSSFSPFLSALTTNFPGQVPANLRTSEKSTSKQH